MSKFTVGQRVRLRSSAIVENVGREGIILAIGMWRHLDTLPDGSVLQYPGKWVDTYIRWDSPLMTTIGCTRKDCGVESYRLEPIVYDGAQPLGYSFEQMMSEFGVAEAVK